MGQKKQLIRITSKTCRTCAVMMEVMRRVMPQFPDIEIIDYERDDDAEIVEKYDIHGVPFLKLGDATLTGSYTMEQTASFLRGELSDEIIEAGIKNQHYFDNSATTPVCREALRASNKVMKEYYGNPSSLHYKGREARAIMEESREIIADALGADKKEIYFTSSGSESDNWAIIEGAMLMSECGKHIISSTVEHDAVRKSLDILEKKGFKITRLKPDETGMISPEKVSKAIRKDTVLVSVMMVNNETGAVNDIAGISNVIRKKKSKALLHTDAVQGFMKIPFDVNEIGVDLLSISGHKIHAPKGIGALYIRNGINLPSFIVGGGQERGYRAGTESLPLIASFGAAVEANRKKMKKYIPYMRDLKTQIINRLTEGIPSLSYIESESPNIINISIPGIRSEQMVNYLSDRGIYVSNSSACKKGARSHVLEALGKDDAYIDSAIRISISGLTTQGDVDALCETIIEASR